MKKRNVIRLVAIPSIISASIVGGFAAAMFTMQGSVQASGQVANPTTPTATAHVVDTLWPGKCNDISVTFSNTNDQPVDIDSINGSITKNPGGVVWRGSSFALSNKEIPANGQATFAIPNAVCLSMLADNKVAGKDIEAKVDFNYHIPVGKDYLG